MATRIVWHEFSVTVDGQKVGDIRENMEMNKTTPTMANSTTWSKGMPPRPVLDVLVAEGFDISLVGLLDAES